MLSLYIYRLTEQLKRYGLLTSHAWSLSTSGWKTVLDWEPLRIFCLFLSKFIKNIQYHIYIFVYTFFIFYSNILYFLVELFLLPYKCINNTINLLATNNKMLLAKGNGLILRSSNKLHVRQLHVIRTDE
jgi:hypothetical protein